MFLSPSQGTFSASAKARWATAAGTGKAHRMKRYRFADMPRSSRGIDHDSKADKDSPCLSQTSHSEDDKGVLYHTLWRLVTDNWKLQQSALLR
jgi:hypothetical protein